MDGEPTTVQCFNYLTISSINYSSFLHLYEMLHYNEDFKQHRCI